VALIGSSDPVVLTALKGRSVAINESAEILKVRLLRVAGYA